MPNASRRRCYCQQPSLAEQARRIVASLRRHPTRTVAWYGASPALVAEVERLLHHQEEEEHAGVN